MLRFRSASSSKKKPSWQAAQRPARMYVDRSIVCTGSPWTPQLVMQMGGLDQDPPCAPPVRRGSSGVGSEEPRTWEVWVRTGGRVSLTTSCCSSGAGSSAFLSAAFLLVHARFVALRKNACESYRDTRFQNFELSKPRMDESWSDSPQSKQNVVSRHSIDVTRLSLLHATNRKLSDGEPHTDTSGTPKLASPDALCELLRHLSLLRQSATSHPQALGRSSSGAVKGKMMRSLALHRSGTLHDNFIKAPTPSCLCTVPNNLGAEVRAAPPRVLGSRSAWCAKINTRHSGLQHRPGPCHLTC